MAQTERSAASDAAVVPVLGVLSLDTAFPRIVGDAGNPASYPFETIVKVVDGADSAVIVRDAAPDEDMLRRFERAAQDLEREGVSAIVSTCGFLVGAQRRIASAVRAPVLLSALSLYPLARVARPGRLGVLTASSAALGPRILAAAGIDPDTVVVAGLEGAPAFARTFLATRDAQARVIDPAAIETAVLEAVATLLAQAPDLSAVLIECGNLPPYADAIRRATGLPVFHLVDAAISLVAAHRPAARASAPRRSGS